jgi:transcriptional regulator with XRE-family HTH domain
MARPATFGSLVRAYRQRAGLTQEQLANALALDFTYISKIERDKAPPPAREKIGLSAVVLKLSQAERDELFLRAEKLPAEVEEWVIRRPEALRLYRSIKRYPAKEQSRILTDLINEIEKKSGGEAK